MGEQRQYVVDAKLDPAGDEQITTLTTAQSLKKVPKGARLAILQAVGQNIRWRDAGTDPTAAIGMQLVVGVERPYTGDFAKIRFIEATASAELNVVYYF